MKQIRESRVYLERENRRRGEATEFKEGEGLGSGAAADLLRGEEAGFEMADLMVETEDRWKILQHLDAIFVADRFQGEMRWSFRYKILGFTN